MTPCFGEDVDLLSAGEVSTMSPEPGGVRCRKLPAEAAVYGFKLVLRIKI